MKFCNVSKLFAYKAHAIIIIAGIFLSNRGVPPTLTDGNVNSLYNNSEETL